jgi:hypothetical protein|tara:strand:+ start:749 stop:1138 length:390 start_codon:yes stop_codon:yes gene_type:complete
MCIKAKKTKQLRMNPSTASNRLKKLLLFDLAKKLKINWCYQCGAEIEYAGKMTIEHKTPWLDSEDPQKKFFELENIAFSHASCNYAAARQKEGAPCPSTTAYRKGCRCDGCKASRREYRKNRSKVIDKS